MIAGASGTRPGGVRADDSVERGRSNYLHELQSACMMHDSWMADLIGVIWLVLGFSLRRVGFCVAW
jgi:hypothetical protein